MLQANPAPVQPATKWWLSLVSFGFVLLQSACTAVMAISGVRVLIGLGALAAASGLGRPARGFHQDLVRIPMLLLAVGGSVLNLYVVWRIRTLRARLSSQWRMAPVTSKQLRSERWQIAIALVSLVLVLAEWLTHRVVHNV